MTDYDGPWKEALDVYFEPFLAFFFPQAHRGIDWSRGYESLDKELQRLYDRGMAAKNMRQLFRFIDWLMELPRGLDEAFWQDVAAFEKEKQMPFMTTPERFGREEGLREGYLAGIELALKLRFGADAFQLMPEVRPVEDVEVLRAVHQAIETANAAGELRRIWSQPGDASEFPARPEG